MTRKRSLSHDSELVRRAMQRIDRRAGPGMRRGGRGAGGSRADVVDEMLYALSDFSEANHYATQPGGGEQGVYAGFGIAALVQFSASTASQMIAHCTNDTPSTQWVLQLLSGNTLRLGCYTEAGAFVSSATYVVSASEVGKIALVVAQHDGVGLKLFVGRRSVGPRAALASYNVVGNLPTRIGTWKPGGGQSFAGSILSTASFRGTPSDAQSEALYDTTRLLGDLPTAMEGATITHRWSARDALRGASVVAGQVAPAELADTTTRAAVDAMARVGSPTVRVIDPSVDGTRSLGAQGFAASSYLYVGAVGKGWEPALPAFWCAFYGAPLVLAGTTQLLACSTSGGGDGWQIYASNANSELRFTLRLWLTGGSAATLIVAPAVASLRVEHLLRPQLITVILDSGTVRMYMGAEEIGSAPLPVDTASIAAGTTGLYLGTRGLLDLPSVNWAIYGFAGGQVALTHEERLAFHASTARAGRIQAVPGKTTHHYDLTADIEANGGPANGVPAQVLDRIGTDHLTRVNAAIATHGDAVGLTGFTTAAHRLVRSGSGVGAVSAQSFWALLVLRIDAQAGIASRFRTPYSKYTPPAPTRSGWDFTTTTTNMAMYFEAMGASVAAAGPYALSAGSTYVFHGLVDLAAGKVQLYANGAFALEGSISGFTASAALECVGVDASSAYISDGQTIYIVGGGGTSLPTPAEMAAQSAEFFATGTITPIAGKQARHTVLKTDIAEAGGDVPRSAKDRVEPSDAFQVQGFTRLEPAQRVECLWSYEREPIQYASANHSTARYWQSAAGTGIVGHAAGFWGACALMVETQAVSSATRAFLGQYSAAPLGGYYMRTIGMNSALNVVMVSGAPGNVTSAMLSLSAADMMRWLLVFWTYDGALLKLYAKRAQVGSSTGIAGYTLPSGAPFALGALPPHGLAGDSIRILGVMGGVGVPSLAEIQSGHDAFLAEEDIVALPGRTDYLVSLKQNVRDAGSTALSVLQPSIGGPALSKVGTPSVESLYARAAGW